MPTNMGMSLPPPQTPEELSVWQRIQNGLLGPQRNYGGLLDPAAQQAAQRQGMLSMGASLLGNSGWSPQKITTGQAIGGALQAGQQGQQQSIEAALNAALLQSQIQKNNRVKTGTDAKSVQEYEYAKANGFTGTFEEWKRVGSAKPQSPAGIQEYEYFQKLTPDQQKQFLSLQRSPVLPQLAMVNGVPTLVDRTDASTTPLSTQQSEIQAEAAKQFESALAKARGTAQGELAGAVQKKGQGASVIEGMVSMADPLIDVATGSATGAAADKVAGWFGGALDGAKAIAQLKVLQASLMTNMPRMEGPQSDADVLLYREAAGQIGDPTVPRDLKKAALRTIRALQGRYAQAAAEVPAAGLQAPATPGAKPKRVRVDAQGNIIGD
jgi:hypothetical protein